MNTGNEMRLDSATVEAATMISKSDFLLGLQGQKLIWSRYIAQDRFPAPHQPALAKFDQGRGVARHARRLFPGGLAVAHAGRDAADVVRTTKRLLTRRVPLFEAGFALEGGFARIDILNPVDEDAWELYEVKAVTEPKDVNLTDIAFQAHVVVGADLKFRRCIIVHLNPNYVRRGHLDAKQLFIISDCTGLVSERCQTIGERIGDMRHVIRQPAAPDVSIGPHCDSPTECPLKGQCWGFLPERNITELHAGKRKGFQLLETGVMQLKDIPDGHPLTDRQRIQCRVAQTREPFVSRRALSAFLRQLSYPAAFTDFESYSLALPPFDGSRPYGRVPFQFSVHLMPEKGRDPVPISFLGKGMSDPRYEFMRRLQTAVGDRGSVVVYNRAFELGVLRECAEVLPEFTGWVAGVEGGVSTSSSRSVRSGTIIPASGAVLR